MIYGLLDTDLFFWHGSLTYFHVGDASRTYAASVNKYLLLDKKLI